MPRIYRATFHQAARPDAAGERQVATRNARLLAIRILFSQCGWSEISLNGKRSGLFRGSLESCLREQKHNFNGQKLKWLRAIASEGFGFANQQTAPGNFEFKALRVDASGRLQNRRGPYRQEPGPSSNGAKKPVRDSAEVVASLRAEMTTVW